VGQGQAIDRKLMVIGGFELEACDHRAQRRSTDGQVEGTTQGRGHGIPGIIFKSFYDETEEEETANVALQ